MRQDEEELLQIARFGNPENLEKFLSSKGSKVDPNFSSQDGATPLIQCVQGSGRAASAAVGPGDPRHTDHLRCCSLLLMHSADPNSRDNLGRTALHWAVFHKKVDYVETLLIHQADPSLRDDKGQNALYFAVRVNADSCLQLLCTRVPTELVGRRVGKVLEFDSTGPEFKPSGDILLSCMLDDYKVLEQRDVEGTPLLIYAAQLGHTHAVKILLVCGAKSDTCNRENQTAAHIAAWGERTDILKLLLRHGAKCYSADVSKITVIAAASACRNQEVLRLILREGETEPEYLDIADVDGTTPLMIACRKGSTKVMDMLIDSGASLDVTDKSGKTAMHHAIEHHHNDCVRSLVETDPSLAATTDAEGRNALHLATVEGDMELIQLVLPHVDVNAVDNENHTAVHWATVCGLYNCIALLIESGCNPATPDAHGAYPIHYATQMSGDLSTATAGLRCLQALLRKGGSSVNCVDNGGKTPLLWAASSGNIRACRLLVDLKADTTMKDENGLTALHCSTCRNHPACLESLLRDCRLDPNPADKMGCTPLFYAITMEHSECARTLLKYGASPSLQDQNGKSPAFFAASRGSLPFLKLLHDYRASLHLRTATKDTPLTQAADAGHTDAVSFLLEHGCSVGTRDGSGRTSLHLAALKNNLLLCTLLVHHKANINSVYKEKQKPYTPLDCAEEKGSTECLNYLLSLGAKHGADIPEELWPSEPEEAEDKDTRKEDAPEMNKDKTCDAEERNSLEEEKKEGLQTSQPSPQERDLEHRSCSNENRNDPPETPKSSQEHQTSSEVTNSDGSFPKLKSETGQVKDCLSSEDSGGEAGKQMSKRQSRNGDGRVDAKELQRKLNNWNTYLQDNVEFLDVVIDSKAPELSEARTLARSQKKELVGRLEELRTELERSCQLLVKDVERREEDRKEKSAADIAVVRRLRDIEERFQRANASAAASLDEYHASQPRPAVPSDIRGRRDDDSDEDLSLDDSCTNRCDSRRQRHEAWIQKKNREYINKRKSLQSSTAIRLVPRSNAGNSNATSRTVVIPTRRSHSIPDHRTVTSPYNAKVILPLRLQEPRRRRSNESQLSGHEQAEIRRRMGELNNTMLYPNASQMRMRQWEGAYDLKEPCTPRWDGGERPRYTLRFVTPEEFSRQVPAQK